LNVRCLGTGGWMPTDRRETACYALRDGADLLVLDAGTGFRRLVTDPALLEGVERLHVVLTHFHLDHTAGLVCLPALPHCQSARSGRRGGSSEGVRPRSSSTASSTRRSSPATQAT
jgi:ribonuclease BN (tRNA processing enzyme)